tara:strand:+ start:8367 stop:9320 length:954 start_codon:yes stop_codon:yes gene_type:complete
MKNDLTSIIINTRNGHETINRAIRSALNQSFTNTEIIVYDNGSSPPIKGIVEFNEPKLKFLRSEESLDLGEARNNAFIASSGSYIVFLDDDDIMLPAKIKLCIEALQREKDVGMVYSDVYVFYEKYKKSYLEYSRKMPEGDLFELLIKGNFILWQSTFFKREALTYSKKPFPSKFNNITDFSLYLKIAKNWKIHYINFPLSIYVIHGGNYSINNNKASQELIMLSNEAYFNNEEKSQLRNYANTKKISKLLESKSRKKLLSQIILLKSTKTKFRLLVGFFLSYIIDINNIRLILLKMKKNRYSEISNIIELCQPRQD